MKIFILITSLVFSLSVFAGPGHGHSHGGKHSHSHDPINKDQTQKVGVKEIARLVKAKKLDASWNFAIYEDSVQKTFKGQREWVVTYTNEKGVKGKKLYIFLKLDGRFVAANFSGK